MDILVTALFAALVHALSQLLLLFAADLVADRVADLATARFAALVAALVADETNSSATLTVPDSHHTWVENDDVKIDRQIQNIHLTRHRFQVHALQRHIRDSACLPLSPPAHEQKPRVRNQLSIKEPSFLTWGPFYRNITRTSSCNPW